MESRVQASLLASYKRLTPAGFEPHEAREGPYGTLELEYRHDDGRRHLLRISNFTHTVFESRTLAD